MAATIRVLSALGISIWFFAPIAAAPERARDGKPCLCAVGYYIAIEARLQHEEEVWVVGASNLPPGSIITISVSDFIGTGAKVLSEDTMVSVGKDGLFEAGVRAVRGHKFKTNMVCHAVFQARFPRQAREVLKVVGEWGEHLGTTGNNPQVQSNGRVTLLFTATVVSE